MTEIIKTSSRMGDSNNIWIGYVIKINGQQIFVNQKGYYQTPSGIKVKSLIFPYEDEVTVNYEYTYTEFQDASKVATVYPEREILGQLAGTFYVSDNITELINQKYYMVSFEEDTDKNIKTMIVHYVGQWQGLDLDLTPYTIVQVKYLGNSNFSTLYIGRTGVLNMFNDTAITSMRIIGRRMVVVDSSRQPYLDEWECVFDEDSKPTPEEEGELTSGSWFDTQTGQPTGISVIIYNEGLELPHDEFWSKWENLSSQNSNIINNVNSYGYYSPHLIKNPKYNTIYGFYNGENKPKIYKIYYIDGKWYDVDISKIIINFDSIGGIVLANVPIEGMINYKVQILTKKVNTEINDDSDEEEDNLTETTSDSSDQTTILGGGK